MDNKNGKTFSDLFSSSAPKSESGKINFENLKSEVIEDEQKKVESSVTFDNLFDKIEREDVKKENYDRDKDSDKTFGFNSLFVESNKNEEVVDDKKSTNDVKVEDLVSDDKISFSTVNFFDNNEKSTDDTVDLETKNESLINEDSVEKVSENQTDSENLFFHNEVNVNNNENEQLSTSGIFDVQSENEHKTEDILGINNNNLFVDDNESNYSEEENPFFSKNTFSENNESSLQMNGSIFESKIESSSNMDDDIVNDEKKSISPFFEEKLEEEVNPLFLEKINLVENNQNIKKSDNIDLSKSKHFDVKIVKKKEPLVKFILGVISYAIFIWLLLIGVALLVYVLDIKIRAARGDYSAPNFNAYVVLTGSMLPEIEVYDVVVTKKVDASKLVEGDIITFASADTRFLNTIITHRIIKKNYDAETKKYTFQTKGDNNNVADNALVPQSNIYGKVILKLPKLGYLQEFLASDGGWILVILIPCLTVISYDIVKLAKGLKRKKYKNIKVQK